MKQHPSGYCQNMVECCNSKRKKRFLLCTINMTEGISRHVQTLWSETVGGQNFCFFGHLLINIELMIRIPPKKKVLRQIFTQEIFYILTWYMSLGWGLY